MMPSQGTYQTQSYKYEQEQHQPPQQWSQIMPQQRQVGHMNPAPFQEMPPPPPQPMGPGHQAPGRMNYLPYSASGSSTPEELTTGSWDMQGERGSVPYYAEAKGDFFDYGSP